MKKKKLKLLNLILIGIALGSISIAGIVYAKTLNSHFELEHSLRLENLAVIAMGNGDKLLACKALTEAKKALDNADFHAKDLAGMIHSNVIDICLRVN